MEYKDNLLENNFAGASSADESWLHTVTISSYNVRIILKLERWMKLANCLTTFDIAIICLKKSWQTAENSISALFIPNYAQTNLHGGFLEAVKKAFHLKQLTIN